jgi:hypothetical protein
MKPAVTLAALFFVLVLPRAPLSAQEHVDVPLPAYDPPPPASKHREAREANPDQPPRVARPNHSPSKAAPRRPAPAKATSTKGSSHSRPHYQARSHSQHHHSRHGRRSRHRRHSFFHWPWEHRK